MSSNVVKEWQEAMLMKGLKICDLNPIDLGDGIHKFSLNTLEEDLIETKSSKYLYNRYNNGPLYAFTEAEIRAIENLVSLCKTKEGIARTIEFNKLKDFIIFLIRGKSARLSGFKNQEYNVVEINKDTILYRYGAYVDIKDKDNIRYTYGQFYTDKILDSAFQVRDMLAVRRYWPENINPYEKKAEQKYVPMEARYTFKVKEPIYMVVGELAYQGDGYIGQTDILQYFLNYNVALEILEFQEANQLNRIEMLVRGK